MMLIWHTRSDNVYAGLGSDPSSSEVNAAKREIMDALIVSSVCFGCAPAPRDIA